MDIDAVFLPVAEELIDKVFPTPISYFVTLPPIYDPLTGDSKEQSTEYKIKAGILSRGRNEGGGTDGEYELRLWIHHGPNGIPGLPTTRDKVFYDDTYWKVVQVDPTYSSDALIASKLLVRAQ